MRNNVFPGKKTYTADYYEWHYDDIDHRVGFIRGEGRELTGFIAEKIETGVAECRNGMKQCQPYAFRAVISAKRE